MQRKISSIFGEKKEGLHQASRAATAFSGLAVFVEHLNRIGYAGKVPQRTAGKNSSRGYDRIQGALARAAARRRPPRYMIAGHVRG